ncbi:MAG: hypothetical protein Q8J88_07340 [Bacteroidales bacterium]|nr:hypothetical protein [Bacteroidales bacterium]
MRSKIFQILLLFLILLSFNLVLFPSFNNVFEVENLRILDIRFSYTHDEIILLFNQLGEVGRQIYTFQTAVVDMIYPLVYSIFLYLLFDLALGISVQRKIKKNIKFLPFGIAFFDYLENFNTLQMLSDFPEILNFSASAGSLCTSIKWILAVIVLLLLLGIVIEIVLRIKRKRLIIIDV